MSKRVASRIHNKASDVVKRQLFPPMRDDIIVQLVRYDELVIVFANKMVEKYRNSRYFDMIRQKIRLVGRFLQTIKNINKEVTDLSSLFAPKFCDDTLNAINIVAGFNSETSNYEAPSVAFSIGTLLKQIGNIYIVDCIKNHKDECQKNAKNLIK